jgi:hypothetical protein
MVRPFPLSVLFLHRCALSVYFIVDSTPCAQPTIRLHGARRRGASPDPQASSSGCALIDHVDVLLCADSRYSPEFCFQGDRYLMRKTCPKPETYLVSSAGATSSLPKS